MSVILLMLPVALLLAGLGVWAFIRAAKSGQFDDLDTPPLRAVFDDEDPIKPARSPRLAPGDQTEAFPPQDQGIPTP